MKFLCLIVIKSDNYVILSAEGDNNKYVHELVTLEIEVCDFGELSLKLVDWRFISDLFEVYD